MSAFILSVIISLLVLTDAKEIGHARIKKSTDGLDKKITAIQEGLSTMIVALEEVKNLTANFAENCKEDRPCSDGWSEFESSCYRLVEGKMSWDDAMTNCKGLG